jgi:hypothetical protein
MNKMMIAGGVSAVLLFCAGGVAIAAGGKNADEKMPLTKSQAMTKAEMRFEKLDADSNGQIDVSDRSARQKARFAEIDSNNDKVISEAEFMAHHENRMANRAERMGKGKRGGANDDAVMHGGDMGPDVGRDVGRWGRADVNGDKAISKSEFTAAAAARFTRADVNNDGTVTPQERKEARQKMRAERRANRGE